MAQLPLYHTRHPLRSIAQRSVIQMGVAVGGGSAAMPQQAPRHVQALAVHDRMGGVAMSQVVKPRIRCDARLVPYTALETVERSLAHVPFACRARKHPYARVRLRKVVQQLPRRFPERDLPRSGLAVA